MDEAILEGVGRALKKLYRCEPVDGIPDHWRVLIEQLDLAERSADAVSADGATDRPRRLGN